MTFAEKQVNENLMMAFDKHNRAIYQTDSTLHSPLPFPLPFCLQLAVIAIVGLLESLETASSFQLPTYQLEKGTHTFRF